MTQEEWNDAGRLFLGKNVAEALVKFRSCVPNAKTHFNCGVCCLHLEKYDEALREFDSAVSQDKYLAVAYFARGTCHYHLQDFPKAITDYTEALKLLRGNVRMEYGLMGLQFSLLRCDIYYNRALAQIMLRNSSDAVVDLQRALQTAGEEQTELFERLLAIVNSSPL